MGTVVIIEDDIFIAELIQDRINKSEEFSCPQIFPGPLSFLAQDVEADIILLDIIMPEMNGIEAIPLIKNKLPQAAIIMNTILEDSETIFEALKQGAVGYIDKQSFDQSFEDIFRHVANNGAYMTPKIARKVINHFQQPTHSYKKLTQRESEIVSEILNGLSYKMVGSKLGVTIDTVRMNIKNIYRKLKINSKAELFEIMRK